MKTHELLDAANLDPAAWTLHAGVYMGKPGEDTEDYLACAFDDLCSDAGVSDVSWMASHKWAGIVKALPELIDSRYKAKGTCDHCGAWFKFGMVYKHTSGVFCVVGHTCASKSLNVPSRYTLDLNRARAAAEAAAKRAKNIAAAMVQAKANNIEWLYTETHTQAILTDIAAKGRQWGSLSVRQIELVQRIHSGAPSEYAVKRDELAAKREAEKAASIYLGEVGKPLTLSLDILTVREHTFDGYPPRTSYWHLMKDAAGNFVTYRGSVQLGDRGDKVTAKFTVKKHEEYNGAKQTVVQRPRELSMTKGA